MSSNDKDSNHRTVETPSGFQYQEMYNLAEVVKNEPDEPPRPQSGIPAYLSFLRFFAGFSLLLGLFATLGFLIAVTAQLNKYSFQDKDHTWWIIALALAIESFLAYGLLNAVADIAKNMIDVGNYVRHLSAVDRAKRAEMVNTQVDTEV